MVPLADCTPDLSCEMMPGSADGSAAPVGVAVANPSGDGATYVVSFAGDQVGPGGSLVDGIYDLTVPGVAGAPRSFHRLFSDADGDGDSDNVDLFQMWSPYTKPSTDPAYKWYFDSDGNGAVDNADVFQIRSRRSIVFQGY